MANRDGFATLRALIVDDDSLFRSILSHQLGAFGCSCEELDSGLNVIDRLQQERFDLLFIDIVMEGKEGIETILDLQSLKSKPPIVAISSQELYLRSAQAMGADRVLLKPIFPDQLNVLLSELQLLDERTLKGTPSGYG